jgi:anthranilate phosphoribosyltransferase
MAKRIDLSEFDPMDVCGTGGDGKNTFNISTLNAFVLAGCGLKICKHGNYGVSSISGSSNVMEELGVKFTNDENVLKKQLEKANICFLHAPLFHTALKNVAPIRKDLGVKTFFNMLGPLINPAQPKKQMVGVYHLELARMYQYLFQEDKKQYAIIHTIDGQDEITLTAPTKIYTNQNEYILNPEDLNFKYIQQEAIQGGNTLKQAANIFMQILEGNGSETQNKVLLSNSAIAYQSYFPNTTLEEAYAITEESLLSQKALQQLNILKAIQ